jgi:hypothetical protein
MSESKFTGKLNMNGLQVESSLFMSDGAEFTEVVLAGASIGGQLSMIGSKFTGTLDMNGLQVKSDLLMRGGAEFTEVVLGSARIGGQLGMSGSKFTGTLDMDSLQVGSHLFMRDAIVSASIPVSLTFAKIGANLDLSGSTLASLDLTGTQVRGEFRLGAGDHAARWQEGVTLTLRNTEVGALQDLPEAWPDELELGGFTYGRLGGFTMDSTTDMATRDVSWFKEWLKKQERYVPQPYEQLASVLLKAGYKDKANDILYAGKERERGEGTWRNWLGLTLLKVFIGYGYLYFRVNLRGS